MNPPHLCQTCSYCAHHWALVCALHPDGPDGDCPDYEADPELAGRRFEDFLGLGEADGAEGAIVNPYSQEPEENWAPEGWRFVEGQLVRGA